jgi:hypothetical protein
LEHLLFVAYLVLFAWLVTKVKFFTGSGLTKAQLVILFLLKVMAGIFYGWIGVYYGQIAQMIDTWAYHVESLQEYHLLQTHPLDFFTSLFHTTYQGGYTNFLTTENSWWNDVKTNFLIKILAIFNVFSLGNYYVNVIFYCFITMFGPVAIYRVMKDVFAFKQFFILLSCFLIPSFLYWTSGLHKEGLIFLGLALIIYHFYFAFKEQRFSLSRILWILLGFALVLILRNFLIITLIPPLFAWALSMRWKIKPIWIYIPVTIIFIVGYFTAKYIHPNFDFPQATVSKQQEFLKLGGGSAVAVRELEPTFKSFLVNAPQALSLTTIRPYPSDVRHLLSLVAAAEINFLLLLFLAFLFIRRKGGPPTSFILFCIFLSFSILMMVGYTVNILGAIVRYRSIVLPLLMTPIIVNIDWDRIWNWIKPYIKKNNQV